MTPPWLRRTGLALLLVVALAGCSRPPSEAPPPPPPPPPAEAVPPPGATAPVPPKPVSPPPRGEPGRPGGETAPTPITEHRWRAIALAPTARWTGPTSGLYTYVLAGDVGGQAGTGAGTDQATARARSALLALLAEVQETTRVRPGSAPFPPPIAATMNQFCIPSLAADLDAATITLDQYDFDLATQYRDWFQVMLAGNAQLRGAMRHSGPFLVATRRPMDELVATVANARVVTLDSPVLVMDMSGYPPEAVPYFVDAFMDAVAATRPLATGALKPLKPRIVAYLSAINQGIPMVAEVWSKTLKVFDGKA